MQDLSFEQTIGAAVDKLVAEAFVDTNLIRMQYGTGSDRQPTVMLGREVNFRYDLEGLSNSPVTEYMRFIVSSIFTKLTEQFTADVGYQITDAMSAQNTAVETFLGQFEVCRLKNVKSNCSIKLTVAHSADSQETIYGYSIEILDKAPDGALVATETISRSFNSIALCWITL